MTNSKPTSRPHSLKNIDGLNEHSLDNKRNKDTAKIPNLQTLESQTFNISNREERKQAKEVTNMVNFQESHRTKAHEHYKTV